MIDLNTIAAVQRRMAFSETTSLRAEIPPKFGLRTAVLVHDKL